MQANPSAIDLLSTLSPAYHCSATYPSLHSGPSWWVQVGFKGPQAGGGVWLAPHLFRGLVSLLGKLIGHFLSAYSDRLVRGLAMQMRSNFVIGCL